MRLNYANIKHEFSVVRIVKRYNTTVVCHLLVKPGPILSLFMVVPTYFDDWRWDDLKMSTITMLHISPATRPPPFPGPTGDRSLPCGFQPGGIRGHHSSSIARSLADRIRFISSSSVRSDKSCPRSRIPARMLSRAAMRFSRTCSGVNSIPVSSRIFRATLMSMSSGITRPS